MMKNKELYKIWAPSTADVWTRFAKPALFVHVDEFAFLNGRIEVSEIPFDITQLNNGKTAIIVDLPGEMGVEMGLGLATGGFRPIPLYNGIHEEKIGGLDHVVDNKPIIDALVAGADVLKNLNINLAASPVFLLDYNRDKSGNYSERWYDNRWSVDFEDLPDARYLISKDITRVVLWTHGEMRKDLIPIMDSYRDAGIEILIYVNGEFKDEERVVSAVDAVDSVTQPQNVTPMRSKETGESKEHVRKFENARFSLLLITVIAFVNLFFMFFVMDAPLLYTTPSIMWLTYLWVSYGMANFLAMVIPVIYLILYLSSQKKRHLMVAALVFFGIDVVAFYIYAFFFYGVGAFTEGYLYYGLLVFLPPIFLIVYLVEGGRAWKELEGMSEVSYLKNLDQLDRMPSNDPNGRVRIRHSRFRGYRDSSGRYRGYGGYGGTGHGGYGGGRGGYGGGFGG